MVVCIWDSFWKVVRLCRRDRAGFLGAAFCPTGVPKQDLGGLKGKRE